MTNEELQAKRQPCTIYSRVVGWITPTKNWNKGKKSEYGDRRVYVVKEST